MSAPRMIQVVSRARKFLDCAVMAISSRVPLLLGVTEKSVSQTVPWLSDTIRTRSLAMYSDTSSVARYLLAAHLPGLDEPRARTLFGLRDDLCAYNVRHGIGEVLYVRDGVEHELDRRGDVSANGDRLHRAVVLISAASLEVEPAGLDGPRLGRGAAHRHAAVGTMDWPTCMAGRYFFSWR